MINDHIVIGKGYVMKSGYVPVENVKFKTYGAMYFPAIEKYVKLYSQLASAQTMDCPIGHWENDIFILTDGRHRFTAMLICGYTNVLVRWIEKDT